MYPLTLIKKSGYPEDHPKHGETFVASKVVNSEEEEADLRGKGYVTLNEFFNPIVKENDDEHEPQGEAGIEGAGPGTGSKSDETGAPEGGEVSSEESGEKDESTPDSGDDGKEGEGPEKDSTEEPVPAPKPAPKKRTRKRSPAKPKTEE